jgi:hypothetical protein
MNTYTRIRINGKSVILRNMKEVSVLNAPCVAGVEVNREGDEVAPAGVDERLHIIQKSLITKSTPLEWNRKYGTLE